MTGAPVRALVPTADRPYYLWQVLVHAYSCTLTGVEPTYLVYHDPRGPSDRLTRLAHGLPFEVLTWPGPTDGGAYAPAMKPWLVSRYYQQRPSRADGPFLYLDPDAVLTRPVTAADVPDRWHASDTDSYTGPGYLRAKGGGLWAALCDLAGVDPDLAGKYPGVGGQYVIGGEGHQFWARVSELSTMAYDLMVSDPERYRPAGDEYAVQAWCAEMYMTQLCAIADGLDPTPDERMRFCWATWDADDWGDCLFFHNAGVSTDNTGHFNKIRYQSSPFRQMLRVSPRSATAPYVDLINGAQQQWPDLIW